MMKNTIDAESARRTRWAWAISLGVVLLLLAALIFIPGLRYNDIRFDREELQTMTEKVRERAEAIRERREAEREKRRLTEPHARKLAEKIDKPRKREFHQQLKEMDRLRKRLEEKRVAQQEALNRRDPVDRMNRQLDPFLSALDEGLQSLDIFKGIFSNPNEQHMIPEGAVFTLEEPRATYRSSREALDARFSEPPIRQAVAAAEILIEKARPPEHPESEHHHFRHWRFMVRNTSMQIRDLGQALLETYEEIRSAAEMPADNQPDPPIPQSLPEPVQAALEAPENQSLEEMARAMQTMETAFNQQLDEVRAGELAEEQGRSLAEARGKLLPTENRIGKVPDFSATSPPATLGELDQRREQAAAMAAQSRQALGRARRAVDQLAAGEPGPGRGASPGAAALNRVLQNQLRRAAQNREAGRVTDLSAMMRLASQTGGTGGAGSGRVGSGRNEEGSLDAGPSSSPDGGPGRLQIPVGDPITNALPGRRFSARSDRQGWLYIDTWYVIGPWDNRGDLRSFSPPHPPESLIDFDAAYPGKVYDEAAARRDAELGIDRGYRVGEPRKLKWQFIQSDSIRVQVPDETSDATYYLFTEVYFEEARDALVAVGSDDAAKVWVNGIVIWQDQNQSSWQLGENYRKIFFRQGVNEILVRLENGPQLCEVSLVICPTAP